MSTATKIPFEEATKHRFSISTSAELREYLDEAGVPHAPSDTQEALRRKCLELVGLSVRDPYATPTARPKTFKASDREITPKIRLDPNGIWQGRKWRIRVPRPADSKLARAELVGWNGKHPYAVLFDEVVSVPEPILNGLTDMKRVMPKTVPVFGGAQGEVTTEWEFADYTIQILGVDPLTAELPGSLTEWYQWKGPNFYRTCNTRELQTICGRLDIDINTGPENNRRHKTDEELLASVLTFLYSDPTAEQAEDED